MKKGGTLSRHCVLECLECGDHYIVTGAMRYSKYHRNGVTLKLAFPKYHAAIGRTLCDRVGEREEARSRECARPDGGKKQIVNHNSFEKAQEADREDGGWRELH